MDLEKYVSSTAQKTKGFMGEFKKFAMKGNVIDLAVAVVIGNAFGKIVSSLVANIITPLMGAATAGVDFSKLSIDIGAVHLTYGVFVQSIIDFIIIAFSIFIAIKVLMKFKSKDETPESSPTPAKAEDVVLLEEIRDLLKAQKGKDS